MLRGCACVGLKPLPSTTARPFGEADLRHKFQKLVAPVPADQADSMFTRALEALDDPAGLPRDIEMIDGAQREQQFRRLIEPCTNAVHHRGNVLADSGGIGTTAPHLNLARMRKQTDLFLSQPLHHAFIKLTLQ